MADMTAEQITQIVDFLKNYNQHFTEIVDFLNLKQQKIFADELEWLHDSLQDEQRLSMAGASLETKRLELWKELGFENYSTTDLLNICPEEYKGRLKLECTNIEISVDTIKKLNTDILELIEKKFEVAEEILNQNINKPEFYASTGDKVRIGDPENDIIGKM